MRDTSSSSAGSSVSAKPSMSGTNRHLDDTLYLRRAHSIGAQRQLYDLIAYARTVNALALHRHRKGHARHAAAA